MGASADSTGLVDFCRGFRLPRRFNNGEPVMSTDTWEFAGSASFANGMNFTIDRCLTAKRFRVVQPNGKAQPCGTMDAAWRFIKFSAGIDSKTHRSKGADK